MTKATSLISFADQADTVSFAIEQKEYPNVDPSGFAVWYAEQGYQLEGPNIFNAWMEYLSGCEEDGSLCVTLQIRLSSIDLDYTLQRSRGTFGPQIFKEETRTEYLKFELDTVQSVDFGEIVSTSWVQDDAGRAQVFNAAGERVAAPAVSVRGGTATAATAVLGVLECQVAEQFYEHELTITPRTPTPEQLASDDSILDELYASTVWMFCEGEIEEHEVELPDNIGTCNGGYGGSVMSTPDDDEGEAVEVFIDDILDYCIGDPIEATPRVYIDGVAVSGQSVTISPGEHTFRATAPGYTPTDEDDLTGNDSFTI